jgi:hypothetical protein
MQVTTIQGIVKDGQILLSEDINLPEMTEVFVVIPKAENKRIPRIMSPRLVNKEDAERFVKIVEDDVDDDV